MSTTARRGTRRNEVRAGRRSLSLQELTGEVPMRCWAAYLVFESNCDECTNERHRRKRALNDTATRLHADFALAPLVTPNNKPRYQASQQRAELFARVKKTQVLWAQAEYFPISGENAAYDETKLQTKRRDWLKRRDQSTNGIMGLFPLVMELPVRFTTTVDKKNATSSNTPRVILQDGPSIHWTSPAWRIALIWSSIWKNLP